MPLTGSHVEGPDAKPSRSQMWHAGAGPDDPASHGATTTFDKFGLSQGKAEKALSRTCADEQGPSKIASWTSVFLAKPGIVVQVAFRAGLRDHAI